MKLDGSGRLSLRNCKFLGKFTHPHLPTKTYERSGTTVIMTDKLPVALLDNATLNTNRVGYKAPASSEPNVQVPYIPQIMLPLLIMITREMHLNWVII